MSDLVEYDVESWNEASIVLRNDSLCVSEVFTIDLNTKAVSGAGHPINDSEYCKIYGGTEKLELPAFQRLQSLLGAKTKGEAPSPSADPDSVRQLIMSLPLLFLIGGL
jgi:hypothetical protein